ncbi:tetratricopeptide repeat protein [Streptomyces sp. NPDC001941]|uniref:tetratricopeptide repeat protein n=1 Tax=Streptomyces sp. NPDC001941 TaxID=3154659 RepID=UPI0033171C31
MRRERLVGVGGQGGPGSGYLVAPRLVLTSAHVVERRGAPVQLYRPGGGAVFDGVVVWCGTPGGRADAALVEIDDDMWKPPPGADARWGRLVTDHPSQPCATWGVPDVVQRPGAGVETAQLAGTTNPGSGYVGNRHVMNLLQHPPVWPADGSSPWSGMSGAAMFCGRLLTGVVAADAGHSGHAALSVVPAYVLHHDDAFRTVLDRHGSGAGVLEAVEFQDLAEADPPVPAGGGPGSAAALLRAGRQVVGFRGREELLGQLLGWCRQEGFGSWLLHGSAGQGKTRLAHQLAATLAADGWAVLWPRAGADPSGLRAVSRAAKPLLVVLDYAETRAAQLAALLEAAAEHGGDSPFKILLLARTAGDWWTSAQAASHTSEELLDGTPVVTLPPLESDVAARPESYRHAVEAFAAALPEVRGSQPRDWPALAAALPAPEVDRPGLDNALTLHMTALADLLDAAEARPAQDAPGPASAVEDRLLLHERRYWEQSATALGLSPGLSTATLDSALVAALLVGAATPDDAEEVLHKVPGLDDQPRDRRSGVLAWIAGLYPAIDAQPWGELQPDRLAERLIGRRLEADSRLAHRLVPGISAVQAARVLTLYSRAAAHPVFEGRLDPQLTALCVRHQGDLAPTAMSTATLVEHPTPLITALHEITTDPATGLDVLKRLNDQVPPSQRLAVWSCDLALLLADRYRALPRHTPGRTADLLGSLHACASRLADLDRREEALAPLEEAVALARGLADADADAVPLVASLNSLAGQLRDLGRTQEALSAMEEAVTRSRHLADADPRTHTPDLVGSLNNLASRLGDLGRREEALAAAQEAVDLRRRAGTDSDADTRQLARSLAVHAHCLWDINRREEAMEALMEAARLQEGKSGANGPYAPGLLATLDDLAVKGTEMGWLNGALQVAERVVHISRTMAKARPDSHLPRLAESLGRLAWPLQDLGRKEEALAAAEESLAIQRGLIAIQPAAHALALIASLTTVSQLYADLDRTEEALAATEECTSALRGLARTYPGAHVPHLASKLLTLSLQQANAGRTEEGVRTAEEALGLYQALAAENPAVHLPGLASSLIALSARLQTTGRIREASRPVEQAVAVYRVLVTTDPATHTPNLARSLYALSRHLESMRRWDEALAAVTEAFRLQPELALLEYRPLKGQTAAPPPRDGR